MNHKNVPEHLRALYKRWGWEDLLRKFQKKYSDDKSVRSYLRVKRLHNFLRKQYSANK